MVVHFIDAGFRIPAFPAYAVAARSGSCESLDGTCRGNGDGMQAEETRRNTGNPAVVALGINWQVVRDGPGGLGWRRGPYY
jgi:hypothetical protein